MIKDEDLRFHKLRGILDVLLEADGEALTIPQIQRRLLSSHHLNMTQEDIEAHLRWSYVQPNADDGSHSVHAVRAHILTRKLGTWTVVPKHSRPNKLRR